MGKEALVIKRDVLFREGTFNGFLPISERDYSFTIIQKHFYHPRGEDLENNQDIKQIIPYVWIINPLEKKVFLYKRAPNSSTEYKEVRYMNKYSGGVGGHIDKDTEEGSNNPIEKAMKRELEEEVEMELYPNPKVLGYINDDSDSIGKVHFGVLAIAETTSSVKSRQAEGLAEGRFYTAGEVDEIFSAAENEVEGWTKISWPFIKKYLNKL